MSTAQGSVILPMAKTLEAKRFEVIRQTVKSTAISTKAVEKLFFCISSFLSGYLVH